MNAIATPHGPYLPQVPGTDDLARAAAVNPSASACC